MNRLRKSNRVLALLLCLIFVLSGCGSNKKSDISETDKEQVGVEQETSTEKVVEEKQVFNAQDIIFDSTNAFTFFMEDVFLMDVDYRTQSNIFYNINITTKPNTLENICSIYEENNDNIIPTTYRNLFVQDYDKAGVKKGIDYIQNEVAKHLEFINSNTKDAKISYEIVKTSVNEGTEYYPSELKSFTAVIRATVKSLPDLFTVDIAITYNYENGGWSILNISPVDESSLYDWQYAYQSIADSGTGYHYKWSLINIDDSNTPYLLKILRDGHRCIVTLYSIEDGHEKTMCLSRSNPITQFDSESTSRYISEFNSIYYNAEDNLIILAYEKTDYIYDVYYSDEYSEGYTIVPTIPYETTKYVINDLSSYERIASFEKGEGYNDGSITGIKFVYVENGRSKDVGKERYDELYNMYIGDKSKLISIQYKEYDSYAEAYKDYTNQQ